MKKLIKFFRKNYILTAFVLIILFVGLVSSGKLFLSKPHFVYVKVKVGQGLWWAATQRPPIWYVDSINKGDVSYGLLGSPQAKILSKRYYRYYGSDTYDIYLTMQLKAGFNKKTGQYTFDRSALSVGSPVDIQFPKEEVTGSVISLSQEPFRDNLVEKTITLTKKYANPWELDAIKVGDSVSDGEDTVFEIVDKAAIDTTNLSSDPFGNGGAGITEQTRYVTVKAKVKLRKTNGQLIFGEDQLVVPGRSLSVSTLDFVFDNYIVSDVR